MRDPLVESTEGMIPIWCNTQTYGSFQICQCGLEMPWDKEVREAKRNPAENCKPRRMVANQTWGEAQLAAQDSSRWKQVVTALCSPGREED